MDDLISEFITETAESLAVLDLELVKLEQDPNNMEILGNIFRLVHTIKGTCGFLGLPRLEHVAHAGENVLGRIRDREMEVSPKAISLILQSLDTIKSIMEYLGEHGEEPAGDDTPLITRLNRFVETQGRTDEPEGAEEPSSGNATLDELEEIFRNTPVLPITINEPEPAPVAAEQAPVEPEPSKPAAKAPAKEKAKEPAPEAHTAESRDSGHEPTNLPAPAASLSQKAKAEAIAQGLAADEKGGAGAQQSIRVSLSVLENLMQMVSELVLTRNQLLQMVRTRNDNEFMAPMQRLSHITSELQEGVMKTRMQPIGNAWAKFPRLIRDLALELDKKIELRMIGAETELDRQLLEMIKDPLTHMVRNSADHGVEMPEDRRKAGKNETGVITLSAYHEGGHIIIEISDDGRGINIERVKQKIITNGLASESEMASMTDQQIIQYIFRPGFSTAEKITNVSGRGVGMDVVKTNIEKIGGTIELKSVFGSGSTFQIKIPLTLAIVSVLIVEAAGEKFAIPQISVLEMVRAAPDSEHTIEDINGSPVLRLRERLLPLITLSDVLRLTPPGQADEREEAYIVVCRIGAYDFGVIVDRIYDTEEIVVKPVSPLLQHIPVYSGCTILGDGSVIMILDPNGLAKTTGEVDITGDLKPEGRERRERGNQLSASFLIFTAGKGSPKAVPLELVSRLEEVEASTVEYSGTTPVVQYRGDLMRLMTLENTGSIPEEGMLQVIVFHYDNKLLGLVIDEIVDIVESAFAIKMGSKQSGYLGSMVLGGKTTDIVDVGSLLTQMFDDTAIISRIQSVQKGKRFSLLLVEDSPFIRNMMGPLLEKAGYNVSMAEHPEAAFRVLEQSPTPFDIIVSDIEMPIMDGFDFAEAVLANEKYSHIPMIAFSSLSDQGSISRGLNSGFKEFVTKTDREKLLRTIARNLVPELEDV
jgi:two-component system chemotaxis sensor kinase CheA